jgi:hypothetical protein
MSDEPGNGQATELRQLAADVDDVVAKAARTVELGRRGFVISLLVFVLIVAELLPWVGPHSGWQVLLGQGGAIPRLFAATSAGFGVLASALALTTRRWWLTWVCAMGGWFASVDGLLAVWSQQSATASNAHGGGPGIGLVIALATMIVLAGIWMRTAWSRG